LRSQRRNAGRDAEGAAAVAKISVLSSPNPCLNDFSKTSFLNIA